MAATLSSVWSLLTQKLYANLQDIPVADQKTALEIHDVILRRLADHKCVMSDLYYCEKPLSHVFETTLPVQFLTEKSKQNIAAAVVYQHLYCLQIYPDVPLYLFNANTIIRADPRTKYQGWIVTFTFQCKLEDLKQPDEILSLQEYKKQMEQEPRRTFCCFAM